MRLRAIPETEAIYARDARDSKILVKIPKDVVDALTHASFTVLNAWADTTEFWFQVNAKDFDLRATLLERFVAAGFSGVRNDGSNVLLYFRRKEGDLLTRLSSELGF